MSRMRMVISVVVLLLFLVSRLSGEQTVPELGNDIIQHGVEAKTQRREAANASHQQQACVPDIHTVLREMSALLAEQRTELRHLKTENQAQSVKLGELEEQKKQVEELKRQLTAQAAELTSVKAKSNNIENQVEDLKRDRQVKKVAFSASLLASGSGTIGPVNTHMNLVFRNVITNIGNAYNPNTARRGRVSPSLDKHQDT
ncbi:uncharacterized protein LOC130108401 isoform X2 [Lampris incognitus]|uniref:uncharacterized protein LOC130108401 isoform X2 n=1 Tax=Lampris incognitus TaxID=2546036 RepID=UPI0024B5E545|nr:uncharacterized protein LOC130108401 isoform X2 [Lampris incognitus]